jgi:hypothetical protein
VGYVFCDDPDEPPVFDSGNLVRAFIDNGQGTAGALVNYFCRELHMPAFDGSLAG